MKEVYACISRKDRIRKQISTDFGKELDGYDHLYEIWGGMDRVKELQYIVAVCPDYEIANKIVKALNLFNLIIKQTYSYIRQRG